MDRVVPQMSFAATIGSFRANYPPREMRVPAMNDDKLRQMTDADGMVDLQTTVGVGLDAIAAVSEEPRDDKAAASGRILWVISPENMPVALEACDWGAQLESARIKHSNLTGGGAACSGGELWVVTDQGVLINAASGRYGRGEARYPCNPRRTARRLCRCYALK
jgi:hypothetical protein